MEFYKWSWSSWWTNIYSSWLTSWTINTSQANYSTNNLSYGKYRYNFRVHDNYWNFVTIENIFYIDNPEFNISTWNYLSSLGMLYWPDEIVVEVRTVWAPYQIEILKNTNFSDGRWNIIIDWDGTYGLSYDVNPYSWPRKNISSNPVLWTWSLNINTDWNYNTYYHSMKLWTIISEEQAAWNYQLWISFRTTFDY